MALVKYAPQSKPIRNKEGEITGHSENPFVGMIEIDLPDYKKRLQLLKEVKFQTQVTPEGFSIGADDEIFKNFGQAEKLSEFVRVYVKSIDVIYKSDGQPDVEFKSIDHLEMYEEGTVLIGEIGSVILNGLRLGKA